MNTETITLLVRESSKIEECLSSIDLLSGSQSKIQVILLGAFPRTVRESENFRQFASLPSGVELYTDTRGHTESCGCRVVNHREIAKLLTRADVVIPL